MIKCRGNTSTRGIAMVTVKQVRKGKPNLYVVVKDGVEVGTLEKYNDTRADKHPWKAYRGIGTASKFIGAFYEGKQAAINAIV